ncbi:MAG: hypothetical protein NTW64_04320 [Candidatus Omnitrophica bacterium]|nr:hypothetical protein [Candidatus Omnitrophota bacterium]
MFKRFLFIFSILLLASRFAFAEIATENLTIAGYFKNETSLGLRTFSGVSKFKNIFQVSGEYKFNEYFTSFVTGKYWYDSVYGWYDKYDPAQYYMQHIQRTDWLRDCYLDYTNGPWFLRLGKQQVSWGQADGVPILDKVNPVDFTEISLPDAVDLRIPLWMANINYSPKVNSNLQFLFIPDFEQSTAAPPGAPFAFRSYKIFMDSKEGIEALPGAPNKIPFGPLGTNYFGTLNTNIYYPAKQFENSKFGVQWSDRISDWDYTLNYLYGFDYLARTYLDSTQLTFFPTRTAVLNYSRRFKIDQMVGGSLNHTFTENGILKGITLRSDAAVYINEPTYYGNPATGKSEGVNRWNNVFWLMGLDKSVFTNWLVSFQFAQYIMEHDNPGVSNYQTLNSSTNGAQDAVENIFSLKISTDFMNERVKPEIMWGFTDDNQGKLSPKVTYEVNDNLWLTVGIHYFYGDKKDSNGQYRDVSQFYTQVKYTF